MTAAFLRSFIQRPRALRSWLRGAVTLMAFTDSGWMRRFRVPKAAMACLVGFVAALTIATVLSASYAVWAGSGLRRLASVERENRSLTTQIQDQAAHLTRLQTEMARLRELEKNLRAVSGLPDQSAGPGTGQGGGSVFTPKP